ncbi:MAG TPA: type VI secretion system tube protein Hcp [Verrucomicrobiales bacterium]|jgi:type VI protein secretion system component Hcp|nr:type VI secretion system tube protein Hcp [Verrucomicrobiales bacterium]
MSNTYTLEIPGFFSKDAPLNSPLLSFSFGSERNPGSHQAGPGRARIDLVNIMRQADKASPHLGAYWVNGRHIPLVIVKVSKPLGRHFGAVTLATYTLTDAVISSYQMNDISSGERGPSESITFNCREFVFKAA